MHLLNENAHSMLTHNDNHEALLATNWPTQIPKTIHKILVHVDHKSYKSIHLSLRNAFKIWVLTKNRFRNLIYYSLISLHSVISQYAKFIFAFNLCYPSYSF